MLRSNLLNSVDAYQLWVKFGLAIGIETLRKIYGQYWPRKTLPEELVWEWYDGKKLIGWTALRHDLLEPIIWVIIGVFPEHQNSEYSRQIFDKTVEKGFLIYPDVKWVFVCISKKNKKYYCYMKGNTSRWEKVGEMDIPEPGYTLFGMEKDVFMSN